MRRYFVLVLFLTATAVSQAADPQLFRLVLSARAAGDGRITKIRFKEILRNDASSIVEISPGLRQSVASSMTVLKAMCALARARGGKSFVTKRLSERPLRYSVEFPNSSAPHGVHLPIEQCKLANF